MIFLKAFFLNGGVSVIILIICLSLFSLKGKKGLYDGVMKTRAFIENRPQRLDSSYYISGEDVLKKMK